MRKKRWMSIMLVLCMILTLLPINTAYADEADTQKDANQVEEVQSDEDIVMQTEQVEEVKPDESVAMQDEQVEEVKPDEGVAMQDEQVEEAKPDESVAMEETVKPAVRMLAPAAVSPAASPEKIKEIELNLKPVTEITNINDFESITYSPSDKMTWKETIVYEGYDKVTGPIASVYNSDKAYTVMYEFGCDENAYELDSYYSKVKINSKYIQDWSYKCLYGNTLRVFVSYPSLKNKVGVTFKSRDQWSGSISNMYVGHDLGDVYSVWLSYYNGLNQTDKSIDRNTAYDPTKDYSVCITIAGKGHAATISPNLTKDDVTINYGTIWKVARDDYSGYTRIYVNFPRVEDSNTEYTVKAKNAEITNAAGEPVSKAKAGTVLTVKLKDLEKGYAFEKWGVDDNSTDVEFQNVKSTTTTFVMPKGEVYISPATLLIVNVVRSKNLTYNGEEQTGVYLHDKYGGGSSVGTLTGHKATEAGTYTARASLNKGYIWSDGTTEDKNIVWTIAKADRDGPRRLAGAMPTKEGAYDGRILATTTEMEYRKVGTPTWKDCPDEEVTGLSPGDYEVRYKDTKSYNRSIAIIYTVPIWGPKTWITWVENGTPNGIQLPKNATITITANPPEKGKEFDKWVPNASSNVKFEDEKSEVTKMTVLGGNVTVRATYKDKEIPGVPKYDLYVINGQGSGQYAYNRKVDITADPAPAGKTFDKWVVVDETVTVDNINNSKTTLTTKGVEGWVVATYKDIGSVAVDRTLTVVNGGIQGNSNPGKFKRNEEVTLYAKEFKNFDKWVVTSGSVVAILPNENALNVTIITSDEDTTIEATRKSDASVHTHTYGAWTHDISKHWKECTVCKVRIGETAHTYDSNGTCTTCGYKKPSSGGSTSGGSTSGGSSGGGSSSGGSTSGGSSGGGSSSGGSSGGGSSSGGSSGGHHSSSGGGGSSSRGSGSGSSTTPKTLAGSWKQNQNGWWYQYTNGTWPSNSWVKLPVQGGETWYYFNKDGYMATGWLFENNIWYYLDPQAGTNNGRMMTGWQQIGGQWYYFNQNGSMATGWNYINNNWYFLDHQAGGNNGRMMTGWHMISDKWYYFSTDKLAGEGSMYADRMTPDGFYVNKDGVWVQ